MRFLLFLAFLTALVAAQAQDQIPLGDRVQGWFNKAKSYIPTATPVVPQQKAPEPPKEKAPVPEKAVVNFDLDCYRNLLAPTSEPQEWYIFITGGNKTCFGRCERAEEAFHGSVNLFAANKNSPNLGYLDCENNQILCSAWSAGAPAVWHFQVPQAQEGGERPETPLHMVGLNATTVTSEDVYNIWADKGYEKFPRYEGAFHPTDSFLARTGTNVAFGYFIYGMNMIPSWMFMIGISFLSRTMMSRRMGNQGGRAGQPARAN